MSWLFGFYAKHPYDVKQISKLHSKPSSYFQDANYYLATGGNSYLRYGNQTNFNFKFFVCGLGIFEDAERILNFVDWQEILSNYPTRLDSLNGHFCGAVIKDNCIYLFTDRLGLRELHIIENKEGWYFSTRIDWLLKIQKFEIDFNEFSSRWLLINQISNNSIIKNIKRLNCGAQALINGQKLEVKEDYWIPYISNRISIKDYKERLQAFILLGEKNNSKISLSLSGGLDSRVILSFLLKSDYKNWDCHTFITDAAMDGKIAEKIVTDLGIPQREFSNNVSIKNVDELIGELYEYIGNTYITESAFISRRLSHYGNFTNGELIIDGGFGEIWRREFLMRLSYNGEKYIEEENFEKIAGYLKYNRADIFNFDVIDLMNRGIINQLKGLKENLPDWKRIGFGNWLDLFSIKTRLVNYYSSEQARVDSLSNSFMPFAQLSLLNELLNMPINERKNYKLFKKIIISNSKKLSKYNLAKGNISYPFYFSPLLKRLYFEINFRIRRKKRDNLMDQFLDVLKEFIMDSLLSNSAKTYSSYNYQEIYKNVNLYYKGETSYKYFVNWFITFEIFRQMVEKL